MSEFTSLNGYDVKDAIARQNIENQGNLMNSLWSGLSEQIAELKNNKLGYVREIVENEDMDDFIDTGMYKARTTKGDVEIASTLSNSYFKNAFDMFVYNCGGYIVQEQIRVGMSGQRAMRVKSGSTWLEWTKFMMETDSGWQFVSELELYEANFVDYSGVNYQALRFRKIGNMVNICGACKPEDDIVLESGYTSTTIFTLPKQYWPDVIINSVQQGSQMNRWDCTISNETGEVKVSRYGDSEPLTTIPAGAYLTINITYFTAD